MSLSNQTTFLSTPMETLKKTSVKLVAESANNLNSIPPNYVHPINHDESIASDLEDSIPIIDFSLLTSANHDQRSKAIHDLGVACQNWGFFLVVNHGVDESLMEGVIDWCDEFFNLTEEEKQEYEGKDVFDPIRCGTSFNTSKEKVFYWRDFVKIFVHPDFHSPNKPSGFSLEYCKRTQEMGRQLLRAISVSLGLDESYVDKFLDLEMGLQIFAANLYPPCPRPELALGLPPHSDHGLLTLLIQNGVGGLQLQHNGKWVNVNAPPNSFLVNTGDHLEILSNGKYRSVVHRAVVNNTTTRISVAVVNGPSLDTIVRPAPSLIDGENNAPAAYMPMKYKDFLQQQQSNQLDSKSCLDRLRLQKE